MYCQTYDCLNNNGGTSASQPHQQTQHDQFQSFYPPPQPYQSEFPTPGRALTPVDVSHQLQQNYLADDLLQPVAELSADQFLLPSFTTIYQDAPADSQSRLYSDFLVDTPQYANLVVPGSTVKQTSYNNSSNANNDVTSKQLVQQPSFASGFLSPFPGATSDFHYDIVQPYPAPMPDIEPETPVPAARAPAFFGNNQETSIFGGPTFDPNQTYEPVWCYRKDAAVDTEGLLNPGTARPRAKPFLSGNLRVPLSSSALPKPHKCTICGKRFPRAWTLSQHMASHAGVKMFYCPLCGKSLARRQNVAYHLKNRHSLPSSVHWALARDPSGDEAGLIKETMRQLDDGSHQCVVCLQHFREGTRANFLTAHARRHSANFCCLASNTCRKRFRTIDSLIEHSNQTHFTVQGPLARTSNQRFQLECSQCTASFDSQDMFLKHLTKHAQTCIERLKKGDELWSANLAATKRQHKCLRCWRKFTSRLALSRHCLSDSHSYACSVSDCNRVFAEQRRLKLHVRLVHSVGASDTTATDTNKLFQCSECSRSFGTAPGLARHLSRSHKQHQRTSQPKKEKARIPCPFRESALCGSMFDRQSQVEKHVKLYHRKRGHRKKKLPTETSE